MIIKIAFKNNSIICPRCFSNSIYRYGKDSNGNQKYCYNNCKRQFTLSENFKHTNNYPKCPICG